MRMGDGPVGNLPDGLDAYAGYVDRGGIGVTFDQIVARFPHAHHLSITVHGQAPAMCADVENGALGSWKGYDYGYTSISNAQAQINRDGRPRKLWTAHYTNIPHRCTSACGFGFRDTADATQWTNHGGPWDETLCAADFFDPPPPPVKGHPGVRIYACTGQPTIYVDGGLVVVLPDAYDVGQLVAAGAVVITVDAAFSQAAVKAVAT